MSEKTSEEKVPYPQIVVAGAGSVGCFVGGMLARGAHHVTLLVRPRLEEVLARQGLTLTDFEGLDEELAPDMFYRSVDPACLAAADIILVTVKSGDTAEMADLIRAHAKPEAVVVSLQNGVGNGGVLKSALPGFDVRAGMVPFNIVSMGGGRFHRGTSGDIVIEKGPGWLAWTLSVKGLTVHERDAMVPIQWGKLLINLNNALNALAGMPLRDQLRSMGWRRIMADQLSEAIRVLEAAEIEAVMPLNRRLPIRIMPKILRLPSLLFNWVARSMLTIDPNARSSMWEDLQEGRRTEIDELQGMIVELGREKGIKTPINACVAELIREAEAKGAGSPQLFPRDMRRLVRVQKQSA
ncbi:MULTISPECIES: 2-dehydropantoate 2-reductase [Shimia]|uniref:2-dehydropantoate 2-reductase n=1 Tax=Shimia TaxID=573139 RepID=UPI001FB3E14D|nr:MULTISPECIES: 2-dehydropantoate 2-reductase [Shimia]MDV4145232.1 2-dehydropantoate 2-reductase [Shimia sp. FJ5]